MIHFFRGIRQGLINQERIGKYLVYAVGEILLVMIGILLALQVNNWNEKLKRDIQFKATLTQLYTTISYESQSFIKDTMWFKVHSKYLDELLYEAETIPDDELPVKLYWVTYYNGEPLSSEAGYYAQDLSYDPNDIVQVELTKEILTYIKNITSFEYHIDDRLVRAVEAADIEVPIADVLNYNDPEYSFDFHNYADEDIQRLRQLISSNKFRAILKSVKIYKNWNASEIKNLIEHGQSVQKGIKSYYPDVKLLYTDLGIIGTAINGWTKSTPMKLVDVKNNIWSIDLHLKKGEIKFRCRDNWTLNWGNDQGNFPTGIAYQEEGNIPITEAGYYRVIFRPETGEYQFTILKE